MRKTTTWVLVCDASRARLFQSGDAGYAMIAEFSHPLARGHVRRDIVTDANGRKPGGEPNHPTNARPGAQPDTDPKEVEADKFARMLSEGLGRGLVAHAYDDLVIVAPPHFLGELKGALDAQVVKRLRVTVSKDLMWLEPREIAERLDREAA
ncbi:MAG TPA: host attachment protein [Minicystis sp.]|nr:host attachment protein [Minicystis sp.]